MKIVHASPSTVANSVSGTVEEQTAHDSCWPTAMSISRTPSENRQELLPVCSVVGSWSFFINAALFGNVEWARLKLVAPGSKGHVPMKLAT
jgi:hypothetical protein